MLIRIVRMEFVPDRISEFRELFASVQPVIASFEGCKGVELYVDPNDPNVYFTHSYWESAKELEAYRYSTFFIDTWSKTRKLFAAKPMAFSLVQPPGI